MGQQIGFEGAIEQATNDLGSPSGRKFGATPNGPTQIEIYKHSFVVNPQIYLGRQWEIQSILIDTESAPFSPVGVSSDYGLVTECATQASLETASTNYKVITESILYVGGTATWGDRTTTPIHNYHFAERLGGAVWVALGKWGDRGFTQLQTPVVAYSNERVTLEVRMFLLLELFVQAGNQIELFTYGNVLIAGGGSYASGFQGTVNLYGRDIGESK
jgi:hypothetical protein